MHVNLSFDAHVYLNLGSVYIYIYIYIYIYLYTHTRGIYIERESGPAWRVVFYIQKSMISIEFNSDNEPIVLGN